MSTPSLTIMETSAVLVITCFVVALCDITSLMFFLRLTFVMIH